MKDFWKKEAEKGKLCFLAPMDGYGDSAYRQTMKRVSPHIYTISEFYSADGLVHSKFLADSVLPHADIENPLVIQIFGKDPEMFAKAAKIIERYNVIGIDINMGCAAKKVVRSGHGSSLFINQCTAFSIVDTLNKATKLPISVKTRLSFDGEQSLIDFAKGLENAGAAMLTVHGRTAKQAYSGQAKFDDIYELKKHLSIPVNCNGDIENYDDGLTKVKDLNGFMIGRCSFGNPWCFLPSPKNQEICNTYTGAQTNAGNPLSENFYHHLPFDSSSTPFMPKGKYDNPNFFKDGCYQPTLGEMLDTMEFHATKLVETKGEKKGSLEIRKHLIQYIKSFPGVKDYRKRLVTVESIEDSRKVIADIRENFRSSLDLRPGLGEVE